jgi:hypothetical protein
VTIKANIFLSLPGCDYQIVSGKSYHGDSGFYVGDYIDLKFQVISTMPIDDGKQIVIVKVAE